MEEEAQSLGMHHPQILGSPAPQVTITAQHRICSVSSCRSGRLGAVETALGAEQVERAAGSRKASNRIYSGSKYLRGSWAMMVRRSTNSRVHQTAMVIRLLSAMKARRPSTHNREGIR